MARLESRSRPTLAVLIVLALPAALVATPAASEAGLPATEIVVLGGAAAVSDAVLTHLMACTDGQVRRVSGTNRFATAANVSKDTFASSSAVFVATGENFPDAVSSGSPAALAGAPILLTRGTSLPPETSAEIQRLGASTIYILGGTSAISAGVEANLAALGTVQRLAGANRFETAAAISQARFATADTVYIATGANFPDALAGAPAAALNDAPILLVNQNSIPAATQAELNRLSPTTTIVLGGTAVISNTVAAALPGTVVRLAGSNRYETAAAISQSTFSPGVPVIYISTGLNFPDALAGGAAGGYRGGPVLLVSGTGVPTSTAAEVARLTGHPCGAFTPNPSFPTCDFTPFTLTGSGNGVPSVTAVGGKPAIIHATYNSGSNFYIWSLDNDLDRVDLLVNEIGAYDGRRAFNHTPSDSGVTRLEIGSSGPWQIDVMPFCAIRTMQGSSIVGTGDDIVSTNRGGIATLTHNGSSNFIIWSHQGFGTFDRDLEVNVIGPFNGQVVIDTGTLFLDVVADGDWAVVFG